MILTLGIKKEGLLAQVLDSEYTLQTFQVLHTMRGNCNIVEQPFISQFGEQDNEERYSRCLSSPTKHTRLRQPISWNGIK